MILISVLVLLLCATTVCASDISDNGTSIEKSNSESNTIEKNIVSNEISDDVTYQSNTSDLNSSRILNNNTSNTKNVTNNSQLNSDKLSVSNKNNLNITLNPIQTHANTNITINATLKYDNGTSLNTGTVIFKINDVTIGYANVTSGVASLKYTVPNWSAQDYNLSVKIAEGQTYNTTTQTTILKLVRYNAIISMDSYTQSVFDVITLKAKITYENGSLANNIPAVFKVNGLTMGKVTVNNGWALLNFTVPKWAAKTYNLSVKIGDSRDLASASKNASLNIYKHNVTIVSSDYISEVGNNVVFKANFTYDNGTKVNNGSVVFKVNGLTVGYANVSSGIVSYTYKVPNLNTNNTLLIKLGENYVANEKSVESNLYLVHNTKINTPLLTFVKQGSTAKLQATITSSDGSLVSKGNVAFKINGITMGVVNVTKGVASISYNTSNLTNMLYNISIKYGENNIYKGSSAEAYLKVQSSVLTFTTTQIQDGANRTKVFIEKYGVLPNYVTLGDSHVSMTDFLYLLCQSLISNDSLSVGNFVNGTYNDYSTTADSEKIYKTEYLALAKSITDCYAINGRSPRIINSSVGTMTIEDTVYFYTRAVAFIYNNAMYPNYGTAYAYLSPSSSSSNNTVPDGYESYIKPTTNCQSNSTTIINLANKIISGINGTYNQAVAIFNYINDITEYSSYYDTRYGALGTLSRGYGNCVDQSHLLIAVMRAAKIPARYVHGKPTYFRSGLVTGHVWAEVYVNGKWYTCDTTSYKNTFGVVNNWYKATTIVRYTSLPF